MGDLADSDDLSDDHVTIQEQAEQIATHVLNATRAFDELEDVRVDSEDRGMSWRRANARFNVRFTDRPSAQKTRKCRLNTRRCMYGLVRRNHFVRCANCVARSQGFYCRKHKDRAMEYLFSF